MTETTVHLLRHGEVHNPGGVLYGRMSGFHLSDLGQRMARQVADVVGERDIVHLVSSPLERARETGQPLADARGVEIATDERLIESENVFQGERFGVGARTSATKSEMVKSVSCPMPDTTGTAHARIARATTSSLNAHRSSMLPPPRHMISTSQSRRSPAVAIAAAMRAAAPSPCTGAG